MNATPDQPASSRPAGSTPSRPVDPPATRNSWFKSYDEEWSALQAESLRRKTLPGINHAEAESLPRVWNSPQG